ncbi:MAG TPA: hypothetical protein VFA32_03000, partial [Dehalococcoidia bacterium]|nr:hypothetical protein [Dehalococcoidia bacterium]
GRPLRKASDLWPRAGRVLIAERLWLKTQRLVSVYVDTPVLSNVWWPFNQGGENEGKPLAIWLNSTLGLLILWAEREETRGAWVDFKKPVLTGMPVLDLSALSSVQKDAMAAAYDQLCQSPLLPFPQMAQDPVRRDIDKAIAQVLGLPDFSVLRDLLAQEPVVCLKPLS